MVMALSPLTAQKAHASTSVIGGVDHAGWILTEALEIISTYYMGDVDLDRLVSYALSAIADALGDEYSYFMPPDETDSFVDSLASDRLLFGIVFGGDNTGNVIIHQVLYGSSAQEEGLVSGDVIVSINSSSVSGLEVRDVTSMLIGVPIGESAIIEFVRDESLLSVEIYRRELPNPSVFVYEIDELLDTVNPMPNTRVVYIGFIGEGTASELRFQIAALVEEGVTNIILDLRNNSGGYMDIGLEICQMLVSRGPILILRDNLGNTTVFNSELPEVPFEEIIVLTDRGTASAAEIIAAALKERGSTVIGEQTFGKTSLQHFFNLDIGHLRLTTHEIFSPSGIRIHNIGITPNIEVFFPDPLVYGKSDTADVEVMLRFLGLYEDVFDDVSIDLINNLNAQFLNFVRSDDIVLREAYEHLRGSR